MVNKKDRRTSLLHGCFVNNMIALIIPTIQGGVYYKHCSRVFSIFILSVIVGS